MDVKPDAKISGRSHLAFDVLLVGKARSPLGRTNGCRAMRPGNLGMLTIAPLSLLKNNAVVVVIFEGAAPLSPVGIEGRDLREPCLQHRLARSLPFGAVG